MNRLKMDSKSPRINGKDGEQVIIKAMNSNNFINRLFLPLLTSSGYVFRNILIMLFIEVALFAFLLFAFANVYKVKTKKVEKVNNNGVVEMERPGNGLFAFYDISQTQYQVDALCSIDSSMANNISSITIDLGVITEFAPQDIIPDSKTITSICFTDEGKVAQIKEKGLIFYARYPERQNKQAERIFFITASLTLLLQSILRRFKKAFIGEDI